MAGERETTRTAGSGDEPLYIRLSPRPARVGVFLPLDQNMPWHRTYEMVLAAQTRLWGGSGNVIFPASADLAGNELFWALADRLDPDYFTSACFTRRDMSRANPTWGAEWTAAQEAAMDRDIPGARPYGTSTTCGGDAR